MKENNTNPTDGKINDFTSNTIKNVNNILLQTTKGTVSDLKVQSCKLYNNN